MSILLGISWGHPLHSEAPLAPVAPAELAFAPARSLETPPACAGETIAVAPAPAMAVTEVDALAAPAPEVTLDPSGRAGPAVSAPLPALSVGMPLVDDALIVLEAGALDIPDVPDCPPRLSPTPF